MRGRWLVLLMVLCLAPVARAGEAPSCSFGPGDLSTTTNPGGLHGAQIPIDHIVVLFQENQSFDSHTTTDQTSVLRFIQTRFDLPALTRRDANADPLLEMFDFASPALLVPPKLPRAVVDAKRAAECSGEAPNPPPARARRLPGLRIGSTPGSGQP